MGRQCRRRPEIWSIYGIVLCVAMHIPRVCLAQSESPTKSNTDTLGDALPIGARLRLGTLRFHAPSTVSELALSPDEKFVVTVGRQVIVWEDATGKELWRDNPGQYGFEPSAAAYGARSLAFAADSSQFFTPGKLNQVLVWNTSTGGSKVLEITPAKDPADEPEGGSRSVDVTPDGKLLALGSAKGLIVCNADGLVLYEIANNPAGPLPTENDRLAFYGHYAFGRFSPDGKLLAVVTSDKGDEIQLHVAATGKLLRRMALASRLVRLAFSPDGKHLAATERDSAVRLYQVETGERLWSHSITLNNPFENYTSAVAYSSDGSMVAACATDNRIHLMDATNGQPLAQMTGHTWYPWALAFSANGKRLYSSGWDGAVRRWDVLARQQLALPHGVHATGVVGASPDGQTLAYEDDSGAIRLVDADSAKERRTIALPGAEYSQLTFSPDGQFLAGGGTSGGNVHVIVRDVATGEICHRWDWPKGRDPHSKVESLCFSPDGSRLAAAVFRQSAIYLWDLTAGHQIAQVPHPNVYGISFSPNGKTLATAGWDRTIRFWETETGVLERDIQVPNDRQRGEDSRMYTVCYAPQGGMLATAHMDGTVRVWQTDNLAPRQSFKVPGAFIYGAMTFSPDGLWLATGARVGSVELWDPLAGKKVLNVGEHQGYGHTVSFGRDSRTLVSGGDDGVCYVWNLRRSNYNPLVKVPLRLWDDLAGDDSSDAYRAIWSLLETPDDTVSLLAEKLRPVRTVIDRDRVSEGDSAEEVETRRRLQKILADKDPTVELAIVVRRSISLLSQLGTPPAIQLLQELAAENPNGEVGRQATAALNSVKASTKH
jgi:WD40 repeat protein